MNTQHKSQTAQRTTNSNKHIHVCCVVCWFVCYVRYEPIKEHAAQLGTRKSKQNQTQKHEQTTQHTNSTNNNKQQQPHTCFLICVLICLLCSLLTYKGTCGIVGNKKSNTKQTQTHTAQPTTNNNNAYLLLLRVLFCLLCSLLAYKGTCGIVGNKKTKQNKHRTMIKQHKNKQHKQQQTTNTYMFFCVVFWYVCYARY